VHLDGDFLDVEHDISHIFPHAGDGGEFVQHAVDLHCRHGRTAKRGEQNTAERIAERQAKSTLERFGNERRLYPARGGELDLVRLDEFLPVLLDHVWLPSIRATIQSWQSTSRIPAGAGGLNMIRRGASCAGGNHYAGSGSRRGSR